MSSKNVAEISQRMLASRPSTSRKLLARKARERSLHSPSVARLETIFADATAELEKTAGRVAPRQRHTQKLRLGNISTNPNTVTATLVGIVAEHGELSRAELVGLMADRSFPHRAARPHDKSWCQGYVAGAIRAGFLAVVVEPTVAPSEWLATPAEER